MAQMTRKFGINEWILHHEKASTVQRRNLCLPLACCLPVIIGYDVYKMCSLAKGLEASLLDLAMSSLLRIGCRQPFSGLIVFLKSACLAADLIWVLNYHECVCKWGIRQLFWIMLAILGLQGAPKPVRIAGGQGDLAPAHSGREGFQSKVATAIY